MRSAVVAATLAGLAAASWAPSPESYPQGGPPAGYEEGSWGSSESEAAPAASSAPSAPEAPEYGSDVWTTEVATQWTTFCPEATQITHNGQTYTASESETITITNCPGGCTISYPVNTPPAAPTTPATTWETQASPPPPAKPTTPAPPPAQPTTYAPVPPPGTTAPPAPYPVGNSTVPPAPTAPGTTAPAYPSSPVPATGAAAQLSAAGAAIMAIFGLVAAL